MYNEKITNALFEAVFRQAIIENYQQELTEIPSEIELAKIYTFSERHNERMKRLFAREERKERLNYLSRGSKNAVVAMLIVSGILFVMLMTIPSVQAEVKQVLIEWYEKFTKFTLRQEESVEKKEWLPSYIPTGYVVSDTFITFDLTHIRYKSSDDKVIDFTYAPIGSSSLAVNNENVEYSQVFDSGIIYYIFTSSTDDKINQVIWEFEGYRFDVNALLPIEDLLNIASSVE